VLCGTITLGMIEQHGMTQLLLTIHFLGPANYSPSSGGFPDKAEELVQ
jgi:hypothetical protein